MILGLTTNQFMTLVVEAIVQGVLWGLMFYYVRKGLNKRNFAKAKTPEEVEEKKLDFYWDAIYGGIAAFFLTIAKKYAGMATTNFTESMFRTDIPRF